IGHGHDRLPGNARLHRLDGRRVNNVATCQDNDCGATRTADRVSANRRGHLHIRRRRGRREDGGTDPRAAAPRRPGRELYRGILPAHHTPDHQPGGLWDESQNFYPRLGGTPHLRAREWRWPCGGKIKFSHLQLATSVYDWQGAQITLICFDELTHFTAHQFFYLLSRNRSTCGVRPYIRATCNPDADSWVAEFLAWWIEPESGFPIPERAGALRYYVRVSGKIIWADPPEDLVQPLPPLEPLPPGVDPPRPISVTFIPASVFDNPALLQ